VAEVLSAIERLFSDQKPENAVILSSTHKAKGLERDRVWLLQDTYLRSRRNRLGVWEGPSQEEKNLFYVAVTRAKSELVLVEGV
jgi:superfamily I DNA/RNA helicase